MRLKIKFSKNEDKIPNDLKIFGTYIYKCLGPNGKKYHGQPSDYSLSGLMPRNIVSGGKYLDFPTGAYFCVSSENMGFLEELIKGIKKNPNFENGMKYNGMEFVNEPLETGWNHFFSSPYGFILKRRMDENHYEFLTKDNCDLEAEIKKWFLNKYSKMQEKGKINRRINLSDIKIQIHKNHPSHRTLQIYYGPQKNITNFCMISIFAKKEIIELFYNYGIGMSTGIGFGSLIPMDYRHNYK